MRGVFVIAGLVVVLCLVATFTMRRCDYPARRTMASNAGERVDAAGGSSRWQQDACTDTAAGNINCLQQALWGKCNESFLRGCDASCSRCASETRRRLLRRTLLVSARQSQPCASTGADAWVMRAMQNHAEYARANGMPMAWSGALVDAAYDGAWNKLSYLSRVLRAELDTRSMEARTSWLLWADWDVVFTDMSFELPLEEYERRGVRLVIGGDPSAVGGSQPKADYLKANTGMMLLRVHNWTSALLSRMLARGGRTRAQRRRHALAAQEYVANLCNGCLDDQAVLLEMLHREPARWAVHTALERRYLLQGHWEDFASAMPAEHEAVPRVAPPTPLRRPGAPWLPPLRQRVFGLGSVPLAVHFAGCQLCSGKAPDKAGPCWPVFRRVLRFAEAQTLRTLGLRHAGVAFASRGGENESALEPLN